MYRWLDHTSELELALEAPSLPALFADATAALAELLADGEAAPERRDVAVEAADPSALLAEWLEELLFLAETEGFVPVAAEAVEVADGSARGTVRGFAGRPRPLVKAVTYHRLALEPTDGGFRATVILDV
jgi:SHS2 domain-containing protein